MTPLVVGKYLPTNQKDLEDLLSDEYKSIYEEYKMPS